MNEMTLFKTGSAIPEYLLNAEADDTTKDIAGSSGGKQISIKGGVWRMIVGGEEVAKNEDRAINIVVVGAGKGVSRTFYTEKYEEGKDIKPACWSAEGVVPNEEVPTPQGKTCGTCPQNIEGSGDGKSRACRYSKRLAVTLENDIRGNIYRLSVPAKSYFGKAEGDKMPLQAYGKFLSGHGIPITGVVTEARFDTAEAVPVLKFRAVRPLMPNEWADAKAQSLTEDTAQAVDFKMVPSRADTKQPALPAAFKDAAIPAKEEATQKLAAEAVAEPVKRAGKSKAEVPTPAKADIASVLSDWATDDDA